MTARDEPVLCVDVGNTNVRFGLVSEEEVRETGTLLTEELLAKPDYFFASLPKGARASAFCSVVPPADAIVEETLQTVASPFRLTHETCGNLPIRYPDPALVGQDRLANALAVRSLYGTPAIVVDVGTAATFDAVTTEHGYEGGVIVPGPQVLLECLKNRTAFLPHVPLPETPPSEAIGRSTSEAMTIGLTHGFPAMIRGILEEVKHSLARIEQGKVKIILTGGGAFRVGKLAATSDPDLTLKGIALAFWTKNRRE